MTEPRPSDAAPYPQHWEADVVLRDGSTCRIRPVRPEDADSLARFHNGLSEETVYFRYFAPYPRLSPRDLQRFTVVDHDARVVLLALVSGEIIGVVQYERVTDEEAEIAFVVDDRHQSRGIGAVFLEHLAAAARERGIRRFVADVLPANHRMLAVFADAGYRPRQAVADGVVSLELDLDVPQVARDVMEAREHRAEARSVVRLLTPESVLVIGASRRPESVGQALLRNLIDSGYRGRIAAVNRVTGDDVCGVPTYPSVDSVAGTWDLALIAVPASDVPDAVRAAAAKGVHGVVVVSAGFGEKGEAGRSRQRDLVGLTRSLGMRLVGPNCLGLINTEPGLLLNASLSPVMPRRGRIGFFSQSGAMGAALLEALMVRGLGVSTFVSAGNRADVSGNDLLQYWEEDPDTDVVLLYLESIGNPRKFTRICRRMSRSRPIVAVKSGRSTQGIPLGRVIRSAELPPAGVDAMFQQAGVIEVDTLADMFDVAGLLTFQPLPTGDRVAVVGNSDALGVLAVDAIRAAGLKAVGEPVDLGPTASPEEYDRALAALLADPAVDSVVVLYVPAVATVGLEFAEVLASAARRTAKTVVATFLAVAGAAEVLRRPGPEGVPQMGSVPTYPSVENAVRSLAAVTRHAQWRAVPAGEPVRPDGIDAELGRSVLDGALERAPDGGPLTGPEVTALLRAYGIDLWPAIAVHDPDAALAAAERLGWPVVLKSVDPGLKHRADLGALRLDLANERALRRAFAEMVRDLGPSVADHLMVQRMAPRGVSCRIRTVEDPLFGPMVGFGLSGVASDLVGDWSYRFPPLTDADAADLIRGPKASPLLFGYQGAEPADVTALTDLVLRVSAMADDLPELIDLELDPVVVAGRGLAVASGVGRVAPPMARIDPLLRRLEG